MEVAVACDYSRTNVPSLRAKGYGRDQLYRDRESHYVLLRHWKSEEARRSAQEDPDMLRCWARLGNEIQIVKVYETLTEVPLKVEGDSRSDSRLGCRAHGLAESE